MSTRWIEAQQQRRAVIDRVLGALPDWFGIDSARREYGNEGENLPCCVAYQDDAPVGFLSLRKTSDDAMEVYVMGILPAFHRQGIGRRLMAAAEAYARAGGFRLLHVKTVDPSAGYASYLKTHAFYTALGFLPLETLPLWDENNPCQLLVKPLLG